jgi:UDP-N-acetylglucosamine:LPS N-acetylglucosamine transferase
LGELITLPAQRRPRRKRRTADDSRPQAPRAVIFSARVGAGHDAVARELAARLSEAGLRVDRHDFLDTLPFGLGGVVVGAYQRMLERAPWTWRLLYSGLENGPLLRFQARLVAALAGRGMCKRLPADTAVVVSTYPVASQVLGSLRQREKVQAPVLTYLTDFSVHSIWTNPHIDRHLAVHQVPAGQARQRGIEAVTVVSPVVDRRFTPATPQSRAAARVRWGLPQDARLALLVGGSWGAGDIERTVADIEATGTGTTCVVVCGRNEALRHRLLAAGIKHAYGWVDDMPSLMHAADVLVQNAGGMSVLEAVASKLPVITYRSIPGHGLTNAAALDEAGVARWVRHDAELAEALEEALLPAERSGARRPDGPAAVRSVVALPGADPVQTVFQAAGLDRAALAGADRSTDRKTPDDMNTPLNLEPGAAPVAALESAR